MMTQSVMTQAANLSRTTAGALPSRAKPNNSGFDMFMGRSITNMDSTDAQKGTKTAETRGNRKATGSVKSDKANGQDDDLSKIDERRAITNQDKSAGSKKAEHEAATVSDQSKVTTEMAEATQAAEDMETREALAANAKGNIPGQSSEEDELQEQLLCILQSIQEAVMKLLELTPEELKALLDDQGLSLGDLADINALQQLVMANSNSSDVMDFLTDSELKATLDQLVEQVNGILKEANLNLTAEGLRTALEELAARQEQAMKLQTEASGKDPVLMAAQQKTDKEELNAEVVRNELKLHSGDGPEVMVVKETGKDEESSQAASEQGRKESNEQEAAIRYEVFLDNLTKTVQEVAVEPVNEARTLELKEIVGQILERIRVVMKPEQTSMEMVLNPEQLGKVNLTVVSKDGTMTAHFKVQNEVAREAIESQLQTLKETLNSQGIKVEAIEVTVTGYSFEQKSGSDEEGQATAQSKNQGQKLTLEDALSLSEESEETGSPADITGLRGTNIDMTA